MAQHAKLAWLRLIVVHRVALDGDRDRVQVGRARVIPTYQYLLLYVENKDMGYVKSAEK